MDNSSIHSRGMDCSRQHIRARPKAFVHWARHRYCRFARILFVAREKQGRDSKMSSPEQLKRSVYMEWAKTRSHARFNLATSGSISVPISEFPVRIEDL